MGRKTNTEVRKFFNEIPIEGGKVGAACKFCSWQLKKENVTRMVAHIERECGKVPSDLRNRFLKRDANFVSLDDSEREDTPENNDKAGDNEAGCSNSAKKFISSKSPGNLSPFFIDRVTPMDQEKITQSLARAAIATGLPFNIFENPQWIEALNLLRPSFQPPNAKAMSGTLLDSQYEIVKQCNLEKIKQADCLTIIMDGWTNIRKESLLNVLLCTPEPVFYKAIEVGPSSESGEYIARKLIEVIEEVGPKKIFLFNADNASNMKVAGRILQDKYPHITAVGCGAHSLNLLVGDILKIGIFMQTVQGCNSVVRTYLNKHRIHATFVNFQKERAEKSDVKTVSLTKPSQSRFAGAHIMFNSVKVNKEPLQKTAISPEVDFGQAKAVKTLILNESFRDVLEDCTGILEPLAVAIKRIESDSATLSDLVDVFQCVKRDVASAVVRSSRVRPLEKRLLKIIAARKAFVCQAIHFAAHILDPRYYGRDLSEEARLAGIEFISRMSVHLGLDSDLVMANLAEYRTKTGLWRNDSVRNAATRLMPRTWWQGLCAEQPLQPIATRLLTLSPTQAACERTWSCFGRTHTKTRNRLMNEKVQKIVAIRMHYALKRPRQQSSKRQQASGSGEQAVQESSGTSDSESEADGEESLDLSIDPNDWVVEDTATESSEAEEEDEDMGERGEEREVAKDVEKPSSPANEDEAEKSKSQAEPRKSARQAAKSRVQVDATSQPKKKKRKPYDFVPV